MNIIKATTRFMLRAPTMRPLALNSNWKERDEAAEKVYITRRESTYAAT